MNAVLKTMPQDLKARVHDFWQANPCGAKFARSAIGSREFFAELEQHRYATEWHIPQVIDFERWRDRDVLEVGCGLGTDAVNFARHGARYTGVDLTESSIALVRERFALEGLPAELRTADAENLPFADACFDLVYSHGVLHHTPDTQRAIDEAHRVLKRGGVAMIMLYHRNSFNYHVNIMTFRRLGVRLLRFKWGPTVVHRLTGEDQDRLRHMQQLYLEDPKRLLSRDQFLNQNTDGAGNPLARVYSRDEAAAMFSKFNEVRTEVHFLNKRWIPLVGRLIPRSVERRLASSMGWHLWIVARK